MSNESPDVSEGALEMRPLLFLYTAYIWHFFLDLVREHTHTTHTHKHTQTHSINIHTYADVHLNVFVEVEGISAQDGHVHVWKAQK